MTLFLNNNVFSDKNVVTEFSMGHTFGGRIGGNFNERNSINLEFLSSAFNQKYTVKTDSLRWNKTISFTTFDVALLYRNFVNGTYLEVGPEFANVQKVSQTNSVNGNSDISKDFVPNYVAGVLGFGANFLGNDNVSLLIGFRATYALADVISETGGRSLDHSYPLNDSFYKTNYNSYKPTNPLTVRLMMELSFDLGYFTRSKCNKRRAKFISF